MAVVLMHHESFRHELERTILRMILLSERDFGFVDVAAATDVRLDPALEATKSMRKTFTQFTQTP